jgi:hypothetical protein
MIMCGGSAIFVIIHERMLHGISVDVEESGLHDSAIDVRQCRNKSFYLNAS